MLFREVLLLNNGLFKKVIFHCEAVMKTCYQQHDLNDFNLCPIIQR